MLSEIKQSQRLPLLPHQQSMEQQDLISKLKRHCENLVLPTTRCSLDLLGPVFVKVHIVAHDQALTSCFEFGLWFWWYSRRRRGRRIRRNGHRDRSRSLVGLLAQVSRLLLRLGLVKGEDVRVLGEPLVQNDTNGFGRIMSYNQDHCSLNNIETQDQERWTKGIGRRTAKKSLICWRG